MRSAGVVIAQPCRHSFGSLGRALEGSGVEPFAQGCLDEAFGLAVGAWRVWPGSLVADAAVCECLSKEPGVVGGAVALTDGGIGGSRDSGARSLSLQARAGRGGHGQSRFL